MFFYFHSSFIQLKELFFVALVCGFMPFSAHHDTNRKVSNQDVNFFNTVRWIELHIPCRLWSTVSTERTTLFLADSNSKPLASIHLQSSQLSRMNHRGRIILRGYGWPNCRAHMSSCIIGRPNLQLEWNMKLAIDVRTPVLFVIK